MGLHPQTYSVRRLVVMVLEEYTPVDPGELAAIMRFLRWLRQREIPPQTITKQVTYPWQSGSSSE